MLAVPNSQLVFGGMGAIVRRRMGPDGSDGGAQARTDFQILFDFIFFMSWKMERSIFQ